MATGWIEGKVTDKATIAGIENVEVVIVDPAGGQTVRSTTNAFGEFVLAELISGEYELQFHKENFPSYRLRSLQVRGGCGSVVDVQMEERPTEPQATVLTWERRTSSLWSCDVNRFDRTRIEDLPGARNIWNLLQTQYPSSITERVDEGGIQTGIIQLLGVHGGTWTQNGYRWDGVNVTDPYEPGKPLTYPADGTLEELTITSPYHSAEVSASGAEFQMISRRGRESLRGQAEAYYLGNPLQSSNLDDRLRAFGFQTTPHFRKFPETEFSFGGPLPRRQGWSYFTSLGAQHVSRIIPDFAAVPTTSISSGLLRLDGTLHSQNQLTALVSGQIVKNSHLGARPGIDPSSTLLGNDRFEVLQGHWTHRHSDTSISNLSFGFSHSSPTDTLHHGMTIPSYTRLFTGEMTGAAPLESDSALSRFSMVGQIQFFRSTGTRWRHQVHAGFDLEESLATEERRVFGGVQLFMFPSTSASEVAEFNSPSHAMQRLRDRSFFAEDDLLIGRIVLRAGVNLDSSNAFLPKQVSGAGVFAPVREFGGAQHVISWTSLSPRLSVIVPLSSKFGDTKFIVGYSRYQHILPASFADFANPNALGGRLYRWNDRNGDGMFQSGEEGTLLRVFGGPFSSIDPDLKRPSTDEWGVGLEHDFGRRVQTGVRLLERDSKRLVQTVNIGVPPSAYTPVSVLDLGDDGIPGTRDDRILTVFNQDPRTLGQDRYLLTNPAGLRSTYKGVEANLTGRFSSRDFLSISFTAYKSEGDGNPGNSVFENDPNVIGALFDDPNTRINSRGRLFFDRAYVAKVAAYEQIPLGLHLGSVVSYYDGLPFGRKLIIPDFNQGPFFVMATPRGEPGGVRTQYNLTFDGRISREFELRSVRMTIILDTFNVLNLNKSLREFDITGPLFAQRRPVGIENPRVFRIGARFNF